MIHVWRLPYKWLNNAKNFNSEIKFMGKFAGWHIPFLKFMMEIDICYFRIDLHLRTRSFLLTSAGIFFGTLKSLLSTTDFLFLCLLQKGDISKQIFTVSFHLHALPNLIFFYQHFHRGKWIFSESVLLHFLILKYYWIGNVILQWENTVSRWTSQIAK